MPEYGVNTDTHYWYVAYVRPFFERKAAERLKSLGVDYFLPVQKVRRKWSDRIKTMDRILIPRLIFIHTTKDDRIRILRDAPMIRGYMTSNGVNTPVVVPDREMKDFMFVVCNSEEEICLTTSPYQPGDRVRVISGCLKGMECELVEVLGKSLIAVDVSNVGRFTIEIKRSQVEKIA